MAETAAHLVDHVLPHKNIRQWVLTFPVPIRLCLAIRPKVMARALEISHLVTSQYYRKKAGLEAKNSKSGARRRGPIATERLSESFPNLLIYKMKTQWRDGTTHVSFSYLDFIARLVALIPPARMNLVRYHGVLAPNFKGRSKIVPKKSKAAATCESTESDVKAKALRARKLWSEMLKRTFKIDVTVCPHCGGRLEQIAVIKDKVVALAILRSLQETTVFKPLTAIWERGPPDQPSGFENEFDQ